MSECRICGNTIDNKQHEFREMMFGLRDRFLYIECVRCGCIQIAEVPADLHRFYPPDYYSLSTPEQGAKVEIATSFLARLLKHQRARYGLGKRNILGRYLARRYGFWPYLTWLRIVGADFKTRILDVGCGRGDMLKRMWMDGFVHLAGADPFVEKTQNIARGLTIHKCGVGEMTGQYDFVISHHSFEHVPDPDRFMVDCARLLQPGGHLMIATPLAQKWAWRQYGKNWVQLDPPRHLFIHSVASILRLAEAAGLKLVHTLYDSCRFQIVGSECYVQDIPLLSPEAKELFASKDGAAFDARSAALNAQEDGDQACFFLRK